MRSSSGPVPLLGLLFGRDDEGIHSSEMPVNFYLTARRHSNVMELNWAPLHGDVWGSVGQFHASAILPMEKHLSVPIVQEAGLASEQAWTLWRTENSLSPTGNGTPTLRSSGL
jgi:hypothetical protein